MVYIGDMYAETNARVVVFGDFTLLVVIFLTGVLTLTAEMLVLLLMHMRRYRSSSVVPFT